MKVPMCSTGLCSLQGRSPATPHSDTKSKSMNWFITPAVYSWNSNSIHYFDHILINSLTDIFIHSLFHRLIDKLSHSLMLKSSMQLLDPLSIPDLKLALYKQGTRGHNIVMDGWVGTCTTRLNKKATLLNDKCHTEFQKN